MTNFNAADLKLWLVDFSKFSTSDGSNPSFLSDHYHGCAFDHFRNLCTIFLACCTLIVLSPDMPMIWYWISMEQHVSAIKTESRRDVLTGIVSNLVTIAPQLIIWIAFDWHARHLLHITPTTDPTFYWNIKCLVSSNFWARETYLLNFLHVRQPNIVFCRVTRCMERSGADQKETQCLLCNRNIYYSSITTLTVPYA
jgi:hypothetical protein